MRRKRNLILCFYPDKRMFVIHTFGKLECHTFILIIRDQSVNISFHRDIQKLYKCACLPYLCFRKEEIRVLDLYLVRHAESEMQNQRHLVCGRSAHTPLSPQGKIQARLLGERMARDGMRFDDIMIPPSVRHYQTLEGVRGFIGTDRELIITDALHELHKGEWDGKNRDEMLAAHPEIREQAQRQGVDFCLPGGETMREKGYSTLELANELAAINAGKDHHSVLAISSSGTINLLVWAMFGLGEQFALNPKIENTSITHLRHREKWSLERINDHEHLKTGVLGIKWRKA